MQTDRCRIEKYWHEEASFGFFPHSIQTAQICNNNKDEKRNGTTNRKTNVRINFHC